MELKRFALGIRFAALAEQPEREFARKVYESIFSVLTLSELEGLEVYGGPDPLARDNGPEDGEDVFLAVIMGGSLKQMRKVFDAINGDAAIEMYLMHARPYIENNRLSRVEGLSFYGKINKNGEVSEGDGTLDGLTVPQKRGKRSPVGKGIKVLLAPEAFGEEISSVEAIKRLTVAARRHFQGVKLVPLPVSYGGAGFMLSLVTACDGAVRKAMITSPTGEKMQAGYAVLRGKKCIMETALPKGCAQPLSGQGTSRGLGELIRRALDEGLRDISIGVHDRAVYDCGMGLALSLGVKLYDAEGKELTGGPEELPRIASADAEFLMPRLQEAEVTIIDASREAPLPEGAEGFLAALSKAVGREIDPANGFAGAVEALTNGKLTRGFGAVLDAAGFEKMLKGVALVVTGAPELSGPAMAEGRAVPSIMKRCAERRVPVAVIARSGGDGLSALYTLGNAGVITMEAGDGDPLSRFDDAADRMFRLIRMGRDVEKIGAPKRPRQINYWRLRIKSMAADKLHRGTGR